MAHRTHKTRPKADRDGQPLALQRQALRNMKRILLHFRSKMDERLRPQGVTTAQLQVLFAIHHSPGSSGAQLARACYITPQTTQTLLQHLEKSGFIVRGKDRVNDRIVTARITPAGEDLVRTVENEAHIMQGDLWRGVSDRELARLDALLRRCLENLGLADDLPEPCR